MLSLANCDNISDLIEYGKSLDISHGNLHYKFSFTDVHGDKVIINTTNLIDRYIDELKKIITTVTFSEEDYQKYKFKPKTLSNDMYGTTEYWGLILKINNITSCSQFNKKTVKLFTNKLTDVLNEIIILEKTNIIENKNKYVI